MNKSPTNNDIIKLISTYHDENSKRLENIEAQVKYTNGQVKEMKLWQAIREDRENRAPKSEAQSGSNLKGIDWVKWVAIASAVAGALIAIGEKLN